MFGRRKKRKTTKFEWEEAREIQVEIAEIVKTLYLLVDPLLIEIKKVIGAFTKEEQKEIDMVYLTGGTANLPGLKEYCTEVLKKPVEIPNCFNDLLSAPILQKTLEKMAPSFSAAIGAALGGLET